MASSIEQNLQAIKTAVYGEQVRTAIHDSIEECYNDVTIGKTKAEAAADAADLATAAAIQATEDASSITVEAKSLTDGWGDRFNKLAETGHIPIPLGEFESGAINSSGGKSSSDQYCRSVDFHPLIDGNVVVHTRNKQVLYIRYFSEQSNSSAIPSISGNTSKYGASGDNLHRQKIINMQDIAAEATEAGVGTPAYYKLVIQNGAAATPPTISDVWFSKEEKSLSLEQDRNLLRQQVDDDILFAIEDGITVIQKGAFESGSINGSGAMVDNQYSLRSKDFQPVPEKPFYVQTDRFNICYIRYYDDNYEFVSSMPATQYGYATVGTSGNGHPGATRTLVDIEAIAESVGIATPKYLKYVITVNASTAYSTDPNGLYNGEVFELSEDNIKLIVNEFKPKRKIRIGADKVFWGNYTTNPLSSDVKGYGDNESILVTSRMSSPSSNGLVVSELIPINPGETITVGVPVVVTPTVVYSTYTIAFLDQNHDYVGGLSGFNNTVVNSRTAPNRAVWARIAFRIFTSSDVSSYESNAMLIDNFNYVDIQFENEYTDDDVEEINSIVEFNRSYFDSALPTATRNGLAGGDNIRIFNLPQPLSLLHFSDIHGDGLELKRFVDFYEHYHNAYGLFRTHDFYGGADSAYYKQLIDDMICTGDLVADNASNDFTYWENVQGAEKVLLAIGNHDIYTNSEHSTTLTQAEMVSKYFFGYQSWGLDEIAKALIASGKTYYYKDYTANNVRLIVINYMLRSETGDGGTDTNPQTPGGQYEWFSDLLDDTLTNHPDYHIVIGYHGPLPYSTLIDCSFTNKDSRNDYISGSGNSYLLQKYINRVDRFIQAGGHFACWVGGHVHCDMVQQHVTENTRQLAISVDTCNRRQSWNSRTDIARINGAKSMDLANVIVIDTADNTVKILRVGGDLDRFMRPRQCIAINYLTGEIC